MKSQSIQQITLSGPKDRSLSAYKDWIRAIAKRLTTEKSTIKLTESEWITYWKDFWKDKYQS